MERIGENAQKKEVKSRCPGNIRFFCSRSNFPKIECLNSKSRVLLPIKSFSSLDFPRRFGLGFAQDRKLINDMTTERVSGNGSSGFKIFAEEMKEKAVFAEHLPLRETELFHKLPVIIIGHIIIPSDSDPAEELGRHYDHPGPNFKNCLLKKSGCLSPVPGHFLERITPVLNMIDEPE
jgi:hypothetical protein